jgi:hypothetical protein
MLLFATVGAQAASAQLLASPYGEAARFGGFDELGTVAGKFKRPVGFAVDPSDSSTKDHNAVYVLDRVVNEVEAGKLGYRLQKLSSTGAVLGSVVLPVQTYLDTEEATNSNPLFALAVDSSKKRVYALVQGIVNSGNGRFVRIAQRLVAWSTIPNKEGKLVPAPGYPVDELTGAGLVAGKSVLQPEELSKVLAVPEGLTIDHSNHDVIIEAQEGVESSKTGATILQRVSTEGENSGKLDGSWVANSTIAPMNDQGDGIFTASNGSFGIDLHEGRGSIARLAEVKPNFSTPEASLLAPDTSGGLNVDEASSLSNEWTVNNNRTGATALYGLANLSVYTSGSPITQLSNGLYAARFGNTNNHTDPQSELEPWNGVPRFWTQNIEGASSSIANMGIRIFGSKGEVITTIGGQAQGQACNLDTEQIALAAGANGSLFALTQPNEENENSDDQVIQYTIGGKGACPQPSGSMTVNGQSGSSFKVAVNTPVTLADTVERKGGAPYRFDWVVFSLCKFSIEDLKNQIEAPNYTWPAPSTSHTFTKKGTYCVLATMYGDYGITTLGFVTITVK